MMGIIYRMVSGHIVKTVLCVDAILRIQEFNAYRSLLLDVLPACDSAGFWLSIH